MKLGSDKVALADDGRERVYMVRAGKRNSRYRQRIAVHEVEIGATVEPIEDSVTGELVYRAPAHVWHRKIGTARQPRRNTGNNAEAIHVVLGRGFGKQLHAEADAQDRLTQATNDVNEAMPPQLVHGVAGRADAGQVQELQVARASEAGEAVVARRDARDWTYSRDVARALRALMAAPAAAWPRARQPAQSTRPAAAALLHLDAYAGLAAKRCSCLVGPPPGRIGCNSSAQTAVAGRRGHGRTGNSTPLRTVRNAKLDCTRATPGRRVRC